jgi:hypothetical protein
MDPENSSYFRGALLHGGHQSLSITDRASDLLIDMLKSIAGIIEPGHEGCEAGDNRYHDERIVSGGACQGSRAVKAAGM